MPEEEKLLPTAEGEVPPYGSSEESVEKQTKLARIHTACRNGDLDTIAALALSKDGLLDDDVRKKVCEFSSIVTIRITA